MVFLAELDFHKIEKKWQDFWEKEKVFRFNPKFAEGPDEPEKPLFSVDTPPPTVSGKMHMGHAFGYTQADIIARYKKMQGFELLYPFGFDDNGLATERMVEKEKNIQSKDFSRKDFIRICLETTRKAEEIMERDFRSIGLACDWGLLYRTIDDYSRKQAQRSFIDIYSKKRAYQKLAPTMYCTSCETAIAQAELEDSEKETKLVFVRAEAEGKKEIIYATTRPELLHACVCITVHPQDKRYTQLVGKKAKIPISNKWVPIITDTLSKMELGSGAVYWCPYGDMADLEFMAKHPEFTPTPIIEKDGKLNKKAEKYAGIKVEEARKKIIAELQELGRIEKTVPLKHTVNVHERCKTPVEILTTKQWFVKYLDLLDDFVNRANEIEWKPKHFKARYDNWINGLKWDWCISRQRHFGVPFPVWYCKKCGKETIANENELPVDPLTDKPKNACKKCGHKEFEGEKDVFDTWFTSSLTPQIVCRWKEKGNFFENTFPMGLRPQGHDIITLWAFNTIVKSILHSNKLPWETIMINGWALDPKGKKMSKSLGNVIEPQKMIEKYSADALRYWAGISSLGEDACFQEKELVAGQKFLTKLANIARFAESINKDFDFHKFHKKDLKLRATDRWIMSRVNSVKKTATEALENYDFSKALNTVRNFVWLEFADYYVEEIKYRVYNEKDESAKEARYALQKAFWECLLLLAPFLPHITEEIAQTSFRKMPKQKSIHLEEWPQSEGSFVDHEMERMGALMNNVIAALRKAKTEKGLPLNSEIREIGIFCEDKEHFQLLEIAKEEIRQTMKIKEIAVSREKAGKNEIEAAKGVFVAIKI